MTEKPYSEKQYKKYKKISKLFLFIFFLPILHLVRIAGILYRSPNKFIRYIFDYEFRRIFVCVLAVYIFSKYANIPLLLMIYFECHIYERFLYDPNYDPK